MEFDFALAQDIGTRSEQQDSAAVCPFDRAHGALFVIADGLGGHTGGARASHIVVKAFADAGESGRFKSPQDRYEQLGAALHASNDEIAAAAKALAKNETMGTTLVAAAAAWNTLGWISVGDSHLYLWRAGTVTKLNEDHSQAGQMLKSGRYKADDPELDAYRSMLRSAVMGREITLIDRPIETMALQNGDILVLATDGLNVVELADVEKLVTQHAAGPAEMLAETLLDAVRASDVPSRDNATVIVARVLSLDGETVATQITSPAPETGVVVEEAVTTAIVTTPFFKAGRQPGSISRPRSDRPSVSGVALQPQKVLDKTPPKVKSAPPTSGASEAVASLRKDATIEEQRPTGRRRTVWAIMAVVLAAGAAGLAWLAYQRAFAL